MLDLALLIMVLAVVISVGLGTAYKEMDNAVKFSSTIIEDKNVNTVVGENIVPYGDFDETLSKEEVIYATQVLDFGMPAPKVFRVNQGGIDRDILVTSTYREDLIVYGEQMREYLSSDGSDSRYKIVYQEIDKNNDTEAYKIIKVS